jgi:DNA helicase-2/ATP-dependent DNA helicase PcrA
MSEHSTVIGPPGTGKTRYLTDQIGHAVERYGPDRVVVASLTKAAAAEIAARASSSKEYVGTLHALCYRLLDGPKLVDKTFDQLRELGPSNGGRDLTPTHGSLEDQGTDDYEDERPDDWLRRLYDLNRARCLDRAFWVPSVAEFAKDFENWKAYTGLIDFTDMIEKVLAAQMAPPGDPAAIFYDEAQDGSKLELGLIKFWASFVEHAVIAGDPQQALYTWRGAGVEEFLAWSERKITLKQSYRLPRAVLDYAEAWGRRISQRYEPRDFSPTPELGEVVLHPESFADVETWLPQVEDWLSRGESVMLLATCAYMLAPVQRLLRERGLPFHNPYKKNRATFNPLVVGRGNSACDRLFAFRRLADENRVWSRHDLAAWVEHVDANVLPHGTKAMLATKKDDHEPLAYDAASALLGPDAFAAAVAGDVDWLIGVTNPKKVKPMQFPLTIVHRRGIKALHDHLDNVQGKPGVGLIVGTVHSCKGGEADHVVLAPSISPVAFDEWLGGNQDNTLRTMYVGMTRAKNTLWLMRQDSPLSVKWPSS